jgi:hypothetical protein
VRARLAILVAAALLAAAPAAFSRLHSGVRGRVTASPTCPVERIPPDPSCAPRGYATEIAVWHKGRVVKRFGTGADGRFRVRLRPGRYLLEPRSGRPLPRCESQRVKVEHHRFTRASLSCDTGIR